MDKPDVSVLVRMDFTVEDEQAVLASGRRALLAADPDLAQEQASERIVTVDDALLAIADVLGTDTLVEDVDGLTVRAVAAEVARGLDPIEFDPYAGQEN